MITLGTIGAVSSRSSGGGGGGSFDDSKSVLRIDTFVAAGTWTRPTLGTFWGVSATPTANRGQVECRAPGAGGSTNVGGGGGGAYARVDDLDLSGASSFAFAGLAGAAVDTNATDATFGSTLVVAKGGLSGTNGGTGGQASASTGDTKFDGGNGTIAAGNAAGGGGAGTAAAGAASVGGTPDGAPGALNVAGRVPGGGGGSGAATQHAGARGSGRVSYQVVAPTGYARWRSYALSRTGTAAGVTVTQPSGVQVGDRLLLIVGVNQVPTITIPGWNLVATQANASAITMAVYERTATGSDAAVIALGTNSRIAAAMLRFAGAGTPEATLSNGSSTNPDPPLHTSTGGSLNGVWVAACVIDASSVQDITAPPTGYGSWIVQGPSSATGLWLQFAIKEAAAGSEDPASFTAGTEQWVAATILVPPA